MNRRTLFAALVLGQILSAEETIRLKTRTLDRRSRPAVSRLSPNSHYILVFRSYPDETQQRELSRRGVRILQYVPDTGLMVTLPAGVSLDGLDLAYATQLDASDKISPDLESDPTNAYLVIFHPDVDGAREREVAQGAGFSVMERDSLLPNQLLATGSYARLRDLAAADEVAYILRASPDLVSGAPVIGCPGAMTAAGSIGEYAVYGGAWPKDASGSVALKYAFQSLTEKADPNAVRSEIERAFREWVKYANISITAGDRADAIRTIAVRFAKGAHGDGFNFDGPGKVLAHTFYPPPLNVEPLAGDIHLDGDEDWHVGYYLDIFSVVLHETGHALGLGHSSLPDSVMYPYYRQNAGLAQDDIAAIQSLYGPPSSHTAAQPPAPPTSPVKDTTPPAVHILNPGTTVVSTGSQSIAISGTASDNVAVTAVKWSAPSGGGDAAGTTAWSASVPLLVGTNVITIRAFDAAGNSAWRALTVVRR